jgi:hypothetical protein
MKKLAICIAVGAAAFLGATTGNARANGGTCVSDGTSSDADYTLVCFTGCTVGDPEQLWHVSNADFNADVQSIQTMEQCSAWYYFDLAPSGALTKGVKPLKQSGGGSGQSSTAHGKRH